MDTRNVQMDVKRSARRRAHSARELDRRMSVTSGRRLPSPSSVERHRDDRGRRAASGSPRDRQRICRDPTKSSSTRSMNVDHHGTSSEHLRRVSLAVRQLADIGE